MDADMFESYSEWANDDLIWGGGQLNWCRAYSKEEWSKESMFKDDEDEYLDHPLNKFGI